MRKIEKLLSSQRKRLGERFEDFVDEINDVNYEYRMKKEQLPKYPIWCSGCISILDRQKGSKKRTPKVDVFFISFH